MLDRRQLLTRTLQGTSLLALGTAVPGFLARTALAATPGRDTVLVVVEFTGGNDGLNTVIPFADELYYKNRPTLKVAKEQVVRIDDHVGLHPSLRPLDALLQKHRFAVVQGVGYPNPDRSHFESMDVWQCADPQRKFTNGWLGRATPELSTKAELPMIHIGPHRLPLALQGSSGSAISVNEKQPYRLELGGGSAERHKARRKLLEDIANTSGEPEDFLLDFVQRRQAKTLTTLDRLQELLQDFRGNGYVQRKDGTFVQPGLASKLQLVSNLIEKGFGTRIFYLTIDGFDTHSDQGPAHARLLGEVADGISNFYNSLEKSGNADRVRLLTFSEFGRRVKENGSKGTDHGAASCLLVAGPGLKAGAIGKHPSLSDLDSGDLRYHTDFRSVYATLLDTWLGCDSKAVLGGTFEHVTGLNG
jgi:uncharacterized protein (DUF1501 family)